MANENQTASNYTDLRDRLIQFLTGIEAPSWSLAGSNTSGANLTNLMLGDTSPVTETWTLVCTSISPVTFSVTGSVSGAQAAAVIDTDYDNGLIRFRIESVNHIGPEDFALTDSYTIPVTVETFNQSGERWRVRRYNLDGSGGAAAQGEVIFEGFGLSGTDSILYGIKTYEDLGIPYHNLGFRGYIGFDPQEPHDTQPDTSGETYMALDNVAIEYWLVATGRRWTLVAKVATVYMHAAGGLFLPYGTPQQYPYPSFIGACAYWDDIVVSNQNESHRAWWDPGADGMYVRTPDGVWRDFENKYDSNGNESNLGERNVWPWYGCQSGNTRTTLDSLRDQIDGGYILLPAILNMDTPAFQTLGEIEGVFYISGFNNSSEATFTIGADNYIVFQNVYRLGRHHFMALRLD